jgi:hypothetical protein
MIGGGYYIPTVSFPLARHCKLGGFAAADTFYFVCAFRILDFRMDSSGIHLQF